MFKLSYIDHEYKEENAFSQWGSFCHELLESYFLNKLSIFELSETYEHLYESKVLSSFPPNKYKDLDESYFENGLDYFSNFENPFEGYEVIGVEQKININIGKYKFVGYIDLILKKGDDYYICDHKSKGKFKDDQEHRHYLFQLYLYSKYIYETYGKYPKALIFNMFRARDIITSEFSIDEYNKALNWAEYSINQIIEETTWYDKVFLDYVSRDKDLNSFKYDDFFCNELCSVKNSCERAISYLSEE